MTPAPSDPFRAPHPGAPMVLPPQAAPGSWRDNSGLATALTVLFVLIALALVVNMGGLVRRSMVLTDFATVQNMSSAEVDAVDLWVDLPGFLYLALVLITAPTFITWQYRHAKNAQILGQRSGLGPGWAIGGWFIPLANFVLPALQLRGSSRWSHGPGSRPGKASGLILAWMGCIVVGNLTVQVALRGEPSAAEGIDAYLDWLVTSDRIEAAGTAVIIAAAALALLMVRSLTAQQEAQRPARADAWSAPASPWSSQPTAYPWGPPQQQARPGQQAPPPPQY